MPSTKHSSRQSTQPPSHASSHASTSPSSASSPLVEGLIVAGSRGQYTVESAHGNHACVLRGRLRKQLAYPESTSAHHRVRKVTVKEKDPVAIGDRVRFLPLSPTTGVIEEVIARAGGAFTRGDPDAGVGELTTVAGLDQVTLVFAARDPEPHLRLLDRFLVVAEAQDLRVVICLNKADLGISQELAARLSHYERIGYPVLRVSAREEVGIAEMRAALAGHVTALLGPSGVGKSSLLNAIAPEVDQRVGAVGTTTHKGRHTTTGTRLYPLPEGGYLADTAGIRALALAGDAADRLDWCFREFRDSLGQCRLGDCRHESEPGCAVRAAVASGSIDRERYESYLRLLGGDLALLDDLEGE